MKNFVIAPLWDEENQRFLRLELNQFGVFLAEGKFSKTAKQVVITQWGAPQHITENTYLELWKHEFKSWFKYAVIDHKLYQVNAVISKPGIGHNHILQHIYSAALDDFTFQVQNVGKAISSIENDSKKSIATEFFTKLSLLTSRHNPLKGIVSIQIPEDWSVERGKSVDLTTFRIEQHGSDISMLNNIPLGIVSYLSVLLLRDITSLKSDAESSEDYLDQLKSVVNKTLLLREESAAPTEEMKTTLIEAYFKPETLRTLQFDQWVAENEPSVSLVQVCLLVKTLIRHAIQQIEPDYLQDITLPYSEGSDMQESRLWNTPAKKVAVILKVLENPELNAASLNMAQAIARSAQNILDRINIPSEIGLEEVLQMIKILTSFKGIKDSSLRILIDHYLSELLSPKEPKHLEALSGIIKKLEDSPKISKYKNKYPLNFLLVCYDTKHIGEYLDKLPLKAQRRALSKRDVHGLTPLMRAAELGLVHSVKYFISHPPFSDKFSKKTSRHLRKALMLAVEKGHIEVVRAIYEGVLSSELAKLAEAKRAHATSKKALELALKNQRHDIAKIICEYNMDLLTATRYGYADTVSAIISKPISPFDTGSIIYDMKLYLSLRKKDNNGYTPLMYACKYKRAEVALAFLKPESLLSIELLSTPNRGYTPLMWAKKNKLDDVVTAIKAKAEAPKWDISSRVRDKGIEERLRRINLAIQRLPANLKALSVVSAFMLGAAPGAALAFGSFVPFCLPLPILAYIAIRFLITIPSEQRYPSIVDLEEQPTENAATTSVSTYGRISRLFPWNRRALQKQNAQAAILNAESGLHSPDSRSFSAAVITVTQVTTSSNSTLLPDSNSPEQTQAALAMR